MIQKTHAFSKISADISPLTLEKLLSEQGLAPQKSKIQNYVLWKETTKKSLGKGTYWLSTKKHSLNLFIQAPHKFHDKHTGKILKKILKTRNIGFAVENSIHRYSKVSSLGLESYDLAHLNTSLFMTVSKKFLQSFPNGLILQLHGFNPKSRKSRQAKTADIILSSGTRNPSILSQKVHKCLRTKNINALLYGKDVFELGGTQNKIGRLANRHGANKFLHIEMSSNFRTALLKNNKKHEDLTNCIVLKN